jgi:hypothetical protein
MPIYKTAAADNIAPTSLERSLAVEVRELHKLGTDCRAASLASFLNRANFAPSRTSPLRPVEANASRRPSR